MEKIYSHQKIPSEYLLPDHLFIRCACSSPHQQLSHNLRPTFRMGTQPLFYFCDIIPLRFSFYSYVWQMATLWYSCFLFYTDWLPDLWRVLFPVLQSSSNFFLIIKQYLFPLRPASPNRLTDAPQNGPLRV